MGLHLRFLPLRDITELSEQKGVTPIAQLEVVECMPLNAMLTDVVKRGKPAGWGEQQIHPQPVVRGFMLDMTLPDDHSHKFDTDGYGDSLTFVYAGDVAQLPFTPDQIQRMALYNPDAVAALAYLKALPANTPVILYWI